MVPQTICPHWPVNTAPIPITKVPKPQCWELVNVGVNHEMTLTIFWIINKFSPPEIHFLPKPWKPPDGVITNAVIGALIAIAFGVTLGKIMAKFYFTRLQLWSHQLGSWIMRELYNQAPKGFKLCSTLMGFGEP